MPGAITPGQAQNTHRSQGAAGGAALVRGNTLAPSGFAYKVGASMYGGPTDPSSGTHGYHGDNLVGTHAYAELGMGSALGNLPYGTELAITYNGKTVVGKKLDIGLGGGPTPSGLHRSIDLWYQTANAIGFNVGVGDVFIERTDGKPIGGFAGKATKTNTGILASAINAPGAVVNAVGGAASSVGDALSAIGKIFGFIFSRQFLYIAIGIPIVFVALAMIFKAQTGSSPIPKHIPIPV